jgi:hypothetical protein
VSAAAPGAFPWPFLVVLLSEEVAKSAAPARVHGLGWIVGDEVVTLAHVAERANAILHLDDPLAMPFERRVTHESFAVLRVNEDVTRGRAASLSTMVPGTSCTIAIVRDDAPSPRLVAAHVEKPEPDGRFKVFLDGRLPEDYTASGSPVVGSDGTVFGIVGPTATSSSVDAFGLDELLRLISPPPDQQQEQQPAAAALAISDTTRSALGYALALTAASFSIGAPVAVLLGILRSAAEESTATVPHDLLTFVAERRELPPHLLVDSVLSALGFPIPGYPPPTPLDDATLRASQLAGVLTLAEDIRTRIEPQALLHRRFLLATVLTLPETAFPAGFFDAFGATMPDLRGALRDAILSRPDVPAQPWAEALAEPTQQQPTPPTQFDLEGGWSTDYVDPNRGIPLDHDALGVGGYVTMFANLIADSRTEMPLSFGLFGEWGSGKSTFMGLLRGEVRRLARSGDDRYFSEIVQIGFNAWHYSDGNLWASLADEIFERLAGPRGTSDEQDEEERRNDETRRERLRKDLSEKLQRRKELEEAADQATAEIARLTRGLDDAADKQAATAKDLLMAVLGTKEVGDQLNRALSRLGVSDEAEQARLLAAELSHTPDDVAVLRRALGGWRGWTLLAVLAAAVAAVAFGAFESRAWLTGGGLAVVTGVAAAASWLLARVRSGARLLHQAVDMLRTKQVKELAEPLDQLRQAEARQQVLQAQLDEVTAQVGELGRELVELSPGQRLYRFIAERAASDTYRGQLGLISTIRKDLEELARLMKSWHKTRRDAEHRPPAVDDDPIPPKPIDRIVLYIDDLDRCSPEQVVEVLQAVHLLLALDLFVVVVGVDPRWLLRALRRQYRAMLTSGARPTGQDPSWETTPQDYLEKIFNIPFALPKMSHTSFQQLVRSLAAFAPPPGAPDTTTSVGTPVSTDAAATDEPTRAVGDGGVGEGSTVAAANIPVEAGSEVAALQNESVQVELRGLTNDELEMLGALARLVETPREMKRLMNLYRIIRSTRDLSPAARFLGDDTTPGDYQAVVILLGLLSGHARLLEDVLAAPSRRGAKGGLQSRATSERWADFVVEMKPRRPRSSWRNDIVGSIGENDVDDWTRLTTGLVEISKHVTITDLEPFQLWAPRIARFSFLLSPYAQEETLAATRAEASPAAVS